MPPSRLESRLLPPEEWHTLTAVEPFASHGLPDDPASWWILVVERDGRVIGTCSLFTAMHWDGWWIDPEEPGTTRGVVLRQLLRHALGLFGAIDVEQVYTGVEDTTPQMADFLTRFGFRPAPGRLYMLRVEDASLACSREN
jgi:N-acetylglutamate synthase-like GNAT family acetyltransferase